VDEALILFTRFPRPGRTKTRLVPALGALGAAGLQREMTARTAAQARRAAKARRAGLLVRFQDGTSLEMARFLGPDLDYRPQSGAGLGERMERALAEAFGQGCRRAILFGTDIPGLKAGIMEQALEALADHDLVLGPARDGGYYLVGLTRPRPGLFKGVDWSTPRVLEQTLARAEGLKVKLLERLSDVDRSGDLELFQAENRLGPGTVSVIIPALNEAESLSSCLDAVLAGDPDEVIVVDGGSRDGTAELALSRGVRLTGRAPGRAGQANLGAAESRGEILIFLHADTLLPPYYQRTVRRTLALPGTSAGAFTLALDRTSPSLRLIQGLANLRSRFLGLPYGDQALFLLAETFWRAGGFPDQPLMEDFELARRLNRMGRVRTARARAVTSARRWLKMGPLKTTLLNQAVILGYLLGVRPETLARLYNRSKGL